MKVAKNYKGNFGGLIRDYEFNPPLTATLDAIGDKPFDQHLINEIVLWKVNRFAPIAVDLIVELNEVCSLRKEEHRKAEKLLSKLLKQSGVDLPMASTLLRFRNKHVFQIIDRHAYRALYGAKYPLYTTSNPAKKIDTYFKYIDDLISLAQAKKVDFSIIDRLLYVFDKQENKTL